MRLTVITCDNCSGEIRRVPVGKEPSANVALRGGVFDICDGCMEGRGRSLIGVPVIEWPRLVRREDVRDYLEHADQAHERLAAEVTRLREQVARLNRRQEGKGRDLAVDLLNIAAHREGLPEKVAALQQKARELVP